MNSNLKGIQKVLASLAMATTVLSMGGFAAIPTVALAATPADYGLHEGDTISADGAATDVNFDPDIYIVNDWGYKRLFLNPIIFSFYGHLGGYAAVKHVSGAVRDAFPTSGLFRNCETNDQAVWGLQVTAEDSGVLHWVHTTGAQAVIDDPNFFKKVFCINNNEFNWYPKGSEYTSVNQVPDYNRGTPGSTPTPTPTGGALQGGAGSLQSANFIGSLNNEEVGEGENNIPVSGLDLEADSGSDLRVLSVRVAFEEDENAAESDNLDDYADQVSLWFNGTKVATADVSDFNEDAGVWSKSISLTGDAVVRMSQTEDLKVAVSALDNIDSADLADNSWRVAVEHVRYVDAQGAITTETDLDDIGEIGTAADRPFSFVDFATAADLELNFDEASDNPESRVVDVDDTETTDDVVLLTADVEATGGDITINEMTVDVATSSETLEAVADNLSLEIDGTVVQTLQTSECDSGGICVFDDVDKDVNEDDSVKVRVLADINGTDDIGSEGATLTATIDVDATDAEDQNGDQLGGGDLTGSAIGEEQAFYSQGIMVSFVSAEESKTVGDSEPDLGTFIIKYKVTAFDTDAFIVNACAEGPSGPTNGEGTIFNQETGTATITSCDLTNTDETANGNFEVNDGENHTFTLTVAAEGNDDFVRIALESINWDDADNVSGSMDQFYTFNLDEFKTDSLYLSSN